ncbi:hypothetical protein B5807_02325 [Epicoccum nigrum]|uniref:Uncharacterized protein n=1 Tax=Epicoccum nigrum TaxID=105696 RepID=A0A1Y2MAK1_EPING|nr:hypothetical protein B5807_02325 [Epicoccum nigrum]
MDPWRSTARGSSLNPTLPAFQPNSPSGSHADLQNHSNVGPDLPLNAAFYQDENGQFHIREPHSYHWRPHGIPPYYNAAEPFVGEVDPPKNNDNHVSMHPLPTSSLNGHLSYTGDPLDSFASSPPTNPFPHQGLVNPNNFGHNQPVYGEYAGSQRAEAYGYNGEADDGWMSAALQREIHLGNNPMPSPMPGRPEDGYTGHRLNPTVQQYAPVQHPQVHAFSSSDPAANPFTPVGGASISSNSPRPETFSTDLPSTRLSGPSNIPGNSGHNLQNTIGQDKAGVSTSQNASAEPFTFVGGPPDPGRHHLPDAPSSALSPSQARPVATTVRKRRGRPNKVAATAAAQTTGATSQQPPTANKSWVMKKSSKHDDILAVIPEMQTSVEKVKDRNDTDPPLDPPIRLPSGLFFQNANAAALANLITYWEPPASDPSIPVTQGQTEAWIHRLVNAINNNVGCVKANSEKDSKGWVVRWANGAVFYRKTAIEALAWRLFQLAMVVHQTGWPEAIAEQKLRDDIYYSMCFTFEQRMTLVEKVLHFSKSTCDDLLKGNRAHEIVGCPQVVFERIFANQQANQDKMNKLASIKSNNTKTKYSEDDQPTVVDTNKADTASKKQPKRNVSSNKSSGIAPEATSKRKRDDEEDVRESDADKLDDDETFRQLSRFSKKVKSSIDSVLDALEDGASFDKPAPAEDTSFSDEVEDVVSAPPNRVLKTAKGAASAAARRSNSNGAQPVPGNTAEKTRRKRLIEDIESEDEAPDASKRKRKALGHDMIPVQPVAQPTGNLESGGPEGHKKAE